jgi:hypothetical protein
VAVTLRLPEPGLSLEASRRADICLRTHQCGRGSDTCYATHRVSARLRAARMTAMCCALCSHSRAGTHAASLAAACPLHFPSRSKSGHVLQVAAYMRRRSCGTRCVTVSALFPATHAVCLLVFLSDGWRMLAHAACLLCFNSVKLEAPLEERACACACALAC